MPELAEHPAGEELAVTRNSCVELPEVVRTLVEQRMGSDGWKEIDQFEKEFSKRTQRIMPVRHLFTPGLYTREIFMPAGTLLTSRIHLFEHPYVISAGVVSVWDEGSGWVKLRAPHLGVTKPATRRVLYIHEDTTWTTFHVTTETDPDKIGLQITYAEGRHADLGNAAAKPRETLT